MTLQRATAGRVFMDTFVSFEVLHEDTQTEAADAAMAAGFRWFGEVEATCSRFDPESELRRLCARTGEPVTVGPLLFAAVSFALELAERTGGAFDPTVGAAMEAAGFDREYRSQESHPHDAAPGATWRDVILDDDARTILLERGLTLDLGAVAKGLAIDLAGQAFAPFHGFVIDAGGDILTGGTNADGGPWVIGLRDPIATDALAGRVRLTDAAICTSGGYERKAAGGGHHILDPRAAGSLAPTPPETASVTVIAETAMAADALATAAFVLGGDAAIAFLEAEGAEGRLTTTDARTFATRGFEEYWQ